jgi:opacity protein-like surface antigen
VKKIIYASVILLAMIATASAQVSSPISIYAGGLLSFPKSPDNFKNDFKNGFHGMVGIGVKTLPFMQFVGKAEYHKFAYDLAELEDVTSGAQSVWMFGGDLKLGMNIPTAPVKPYVLGGIGLARITFSEFEGGDPLTTALLNTALPGNQTKLYYNIGGGLEFKFAPMVNFFVQGRYVRIATDDQATSFIPITLGLKFF